ncbi:hypothetical protein AGDE_12966 [Angomonas deanei]|uniref:Adenine DNA glycosylase n=1 Tax=Angomonas deanei TaxID=59799 RepID=A0A7G2CFX5_9TRYP|nr:hypothetical protein AGDE_12966 [Angomonas deanei]CAD2218798.1 HhH-GPD superfamily base excision DNA repair protein/Helix-hairpin-helix motif containing protein, putative [Angomonas deanei]|eukprot:EPY23258.1 hypothetical protein AGDE_12966 [Angomonas deanei]
MSQQTQMETVIRYFDKWVTKFPTVEALAAATEEQVRAVWSGMGYYRRAEYMRKGAQYVVETHRKGSKSGPVALPRRYEELLKIPGVGPYTAAAIASVCYGEPVCAVDGNVVRVLSRLRGERDFDPKVPKNIKKSW